MSDPEDLGDWSLHCFCPLARVTPHTLVSENGRLLYEARSGITLRTLRRAGVQVSEEQLNRLNAFGLLAIDGKQLRTCFPVIGSETSGEMRRQLGSMSVVLVERMAPAIAALTNELHDHGYDGSSYAVVFGYAFDGLLWDKLKRRGVLPDTYLTRERPWWNGAFWAIYPPREESAGTNFVYGSRATLVLVWTGATHADLEALRAIDGLPDFVDALVSTESRRPRQLEDRSGRVWRFEQSDGRLALPLVGGRGRLDVSAGAIADIVAEALRGDEFGAICNLVPAVERTVATVVVTHELIWEITESLIRNALLTKPPAFALDTPTPAALLDLLYLQLRPVR